MKDNKGIAFCVLTFAVHRDFSEIVGSLYAYEDDQMKDVTTTISGMDTSLDWTIHPNGEDKYGFIEMDYQTIEYTLEDGNIFQHFIKIGSGTSSASYNLAPVRGADNTLQLTGVALNEDFSSESYYAVLNRKDTTVDTY